jgi:hypothetical protein
MGVTRAWSPRDVQHRWRAFLPLTYMWPVLWLLSLGPGGAVPAAGFATFIGVGALTPFYLYWRASSRRGLLADPAGLALKSGGRELQRVPWDEITAIIVARGARRNEWALRFPLFPSVRIVLADRWAPDLSWRLFAHTDADFGSLRYFVEESARRHRLGVDVDGYV